MSIASQGSGVGCNRFTSVTPSDSVPIGNATWLRIGAAGNLVLRGPSDAADVTIAVTAGEYLPVGAGILVKVATTATGIVAFD
jgi:hypothetical protein